MAKKYPNAESFKQALSAKLQAISKAEGKSVEALQYRIVFERFLARIFHNKNVSWVVKGAYSLELRYKDEGINRTTTDIDFVLKELKNLTEDEILQMLKNICKIDLEDWFSFEVFPSKDLALPVYGGWRYHVVASIGSKKFKEFNVDVVAGDRFISEIEWTSGHELLSFAEIETPEIAIIPLGKQFAEKIHTLTNPTIEHNSRVKDFVDIVIYIDKGLPEKSVLVKEIENTFNSRRTHEVPKVILKPAADWALPYEKMANDWGASKKTVEEAHKYVSDFWIDLYSI